MRSCDGPTLGAALALVRTMTPRTRPKIMDSNQPVVAEAGCNALAKSRRFDHERSDRDQANSKRGPSQAIANGLRTWICGPVAYLPERTLPTSEIAAATGRSVAWFTARTGITERRRAGPGETAETMAVAAVRALEKATCFPISECDLVIGATYTPSDTIATLAHQVQRAFAIENARVFQVSAACTSAFVAMEIAQSFLQCGRAKTVLIAAAEHNSLYSDDADEQAGHLWGDAAAAFLLSATPSQTAGYEVIDVATSGLAHIGHGPDGIFLNPKSGGLRMPHGKDVFAQACQAMESASRSMLAKHGLTPRNLRLLVPHQANLRILERVASRLGVDESRCAITVRELGNTGCVSPLVSLLPYEHKLEDGDYILLVAFGGGYSVGAALLRRCIAENFGERS